MTGFGRGVTEIGNVRITVEAKSVNHRFFECSIRMPRQHFQLEDQLKKMISQYIKRGKVDVFITITGDEGAKQKLSVDWPLVDLYYKFASELKDRFELTEEISLTHLLSNPAFATLEESQTGASEWEGHIQTALKQAVEHLHSMRKYEGIELEKDLHLQLKSFKKCLHNAKEISPTIVAKYKDRLEKRIKEFADGHIDENRLLTEVAVFAEKTDVTEEFTRLESHVVQFEHASLQMEPIGRRLDFLTQEMNREVNTIGSKANDAKLTSHVVDMKSMLEKIREQVQNIE
ncbi:YicC family protein [Jeotgalibacillus sp. S-D1]|nr:YicC family protein [Jeotgalibacillus sp. S-D1]